MLRTRFKTLKFMLKASGNGTLDNFQRFLRGERNISRQQEVELGKKTRYLIKPFLISLGQDQYAEAFVNKRAQEKHNALMSSDWRTEHGLTPVPAQIPDNMEIIDFEDFRPAKLVVRAGGTTSARKTSAVTGRRYKTMSGAESWSVPFGKKQATDVFQERAEKLMEDVSKKEESAGRNIHVSVIPEIYLPAG